VTKHFFDATFGNVGAAFDLGPKRPGDILSELEAEARRLFLGATVTNLPQSAAKRIG